MANTSKKYFNQNFKKAVWDDFFDGIKRIKNGQELDSFLDRYLPPREKVMLEKRLGMFYLLKEGKGSREIGRQIDITLRTISFIKKGFKPPTKRKIKKEKSKTKIPPLFGEFAKKENSIFPTSYSGKGRWRIR